jgi:hypothetical protein
MHRIRYYHRFHNAIPKSGVGYLRITHPFATVPCGTVRHACLIHAASVRSEPESNPPKINKLIFKVNDPLNKITLKMTRVVLIPFGIRTTSRSSHHAINFSKIVSGLFPFAKQLFYKK